MFGWRNALNNCIFLVACLAAGMAHAAEASSDSRRRAEARRQASDIAPPARVTPELERIMGKDARALVQLLGQPVQDVREDAARKLQFANADCILDAYLYPPGDGRTPVVTYVTARVPDGRDAERSSCIAALRQRR